MTAVGRVLAASALCLSLELPMAAMLRQGPHDDDAHAEAFHQYMARHRRPYQRGSSEYKERLALFSQRRSEVDAQNAHPGSLWTAGINKFSDRTKAELARFQGWRGRAARSSGTPGGLLRGWAGAALRQEGPGRTAPSEFMEWGKLESAQSADQGSCGSCWAVATAKMMDLHMQIYNPGEQGPFSAQELVSCVPNPENCGGSGGCAGATVELALHWTALKGLAKSSETPYTASDGTCKKTVDAGGLMQLPDAGEEITSVGIHKVPDGSPSISFGMVAWERLPVNRYQPLLQALYEHGPVGVSVAAGNWFAYVGGIFDSCGEDWVINHAVVCIGYGKSESGVSYYSIQNSWGSDWGEDGRIRIIRRDDDEDRCGTDRQPEVGTGCDGGPGQVRVCGPCGVLYDNALPHFRNATA